MIDDPQASHFQQKNLPKNVWRPGSARTRWGAYSAPPDPLAATKIQALAYTTTQSMSVEEVKAF